MPKLMKEIKAETIIILKDGEDQILIGMMGWSATLTSRMPKTTRCSRETSKME
jgi:hypothetical protein